MKRFEYDNVRTDLINILSSKTGMDGDILPNSTTMRLLEAFAEKFSELAMYAEYLTRESKWSLCQNLSSLMTMVDLFGYKVHRKVGASGYITVSAGQGFNSSYSNEIIIPKFTRFSNGEFTYCSIKDVSLKPDMNYVKVPVIEGDLNVFEFTGDRTDLFIDDVVSIENDSVENSLYELTNNGIICTEVNNWFDSQININNDTKITNDPYNNFEYKVKNKNDFSGIELHFYQSSHDENDNFVFKYLTTHGEEGDCLKYNTVTQILDVIRDINGFKVNLYASNLKDDLFSGEISGGKDYETMEEIRENASYTFNRWHYDSSDTTYGGKIIVKDDYISALKSELPQYLFQVWTDYEEQNSSIEDYDFINNSKIYVSGVEKDTNLRRLTSSSLNSMNYKDLIAPILNRKPLTDYFIFRPSMIYKFYFIGTVYYDQDKNTIANVKDYISDTLIKTYFYDKSAKVMSSFLKYENNLYFSNFIGMFDDIQTVHHADLKVIAYKDVEYEFVSEGSVDYTKQLPDKLQTLPIEPFTALTNITNHESEEHEFVVPEVINNEMAYYISTVETDNELFNIIEDIAKVVVTISSSNVVEYSLFAKVKTGRFTNGWVPTDDSAEEYEDYFEIFKWTADVPKTPDVNHIFDSLTFDSTKDEGKKLMQRILAKSFILTQDKKAQYIEGTSIVKCYYEKIDNEYILKDYAYDEELAENTFEYSYDKDNLKYYGLCIRFAPKNSNCRTLSKNEILTLTDSFNEQVGDYGVINPFKQVPLEIDESSYEDKGLIFRGKDQ